jgi:hypothetical protein
MRAEVTRATTKIRRSNQLLEYRRINWNVETNHRIRAEFESFIRTAREVGFPFGLRLQQHETPNEEVIQISTDRSLIGIVDREHHAFWVNPQYTDTPVFETGGELVASQSATGYVHFIIHPRCSDRLTPTRKELILFRPFGILWKSLRAWFKKYLIVIF